MNKGLTALVLGTVITLAATMGGIGLVVKGAAEAAYNDEVKSQPSMLRERKLDKYDKPNVSRENRKENPMRITDPIGKISEINKTWGAYFSDKTLKGQIILGRYKVALINANDEVFQEFPIDISLTEEEGRYLFQTGRGITGYFSKNILADNK